MCWNLLYGGLEWLGQLVGFIAVKEFFRRGLWGGVSICGIIIAIFMNNVQQRGPRILDATNGEQPDQIDDAIAPQGLIV